MSATIFKMPLETPMGDDCAALRLHAHGDLFHAFDKARNILEPHAVKAPAFNDFALIA